MCRNKPPKKKSRLLGSSRSEFGASSYGLSKKCQLSNGSTGNSNPLKGFSSLLTIDDDKKDYKGSISSSNSNKSNSNSNSNNSNWNSNNSNNSNNNNNNNNTSRDDEELCECIVCYEDFVSNDKIYQCCEGHLLCGDCYPKLSKCPVCNIILSCTNRIRNRALESVLSRSGSSSNTNNNNNNTNSSNSNNNSSSINNNYGTQKTKSTTFCDCYFFNENEKIHRQNTCLFKCNIKNINSDLISHINKCSYRRIICSFSDCRWQGRFIDYEHHLQKKHFTLISPISQTKHNKHNNKHDKHDSKHSKNKKSKSNSNNNNNNSKQQKQYEFSHAIKFPSAAFESSNNNVC